MSVSNNTDSLFEAPWYHFSQISSTNDYLLALPLEKRISGTTCSADVQTQGKGRNDRVWFSPLGGIYLSILVIPVSPIQTWSTLPLAAAVAVSDILLKIDETLDVTHKWPNDLLIRGKKVGGILTQSRLGDHPFAVIGIGLNVQIEREDLPHRMLFPATSLHYETKSTLCDKWILSHLRQSVLDVFFEWENSADGIIARWKQLSFSTGHLVTIQSLTHCMTGFDRGIAEDGSLLIDSDGALHLIRSADLVSRETDNENANC